MRLKRSRSGLGLIELMIALLLASVVLLGGINLYLLMVRGEHDVSARNRLTGEFRALVNVVSRDLRRAGFWHWTPATVSPDLWENPFTGPETDLRVGAASGEPVNSCVLFSYDLDKDGLVGDLQSPPAVTRERFGFRLRENVIETYTGGDWNCSDGSWEQLSTPGVEITELSFDLSEAILDVTDPNSAIAGAYCPPGTSCQFIRTVAYTLSGRLRRAPQIAETLVGRVRLRNDKIALGVSP